MATNGIASPVWFVNRPDLTPRGRVLRFGSRNVLKLVSRSNQRTLCRRFNTWVHAEARPKTFSKKRRVAFEGDLRQQLRACEDEITSLRTQLAALSTSSPLPPPAPRPTTCAGARGPKPPPDAAPPAAPGTAAPPLPPRPLVPRLPWSARDPPAPPPPP